MIKNLNQIAIGCLIGFIVNTVAASELDVEPEKVAAIKRLLEVTGAEANQEELVNTFTQQLISVLQANNTSLTPENAAVIRSEVQKVVAEQLAQETLQTKMYVIYARYFTLEELNGLIEFNETPIGAKANRVMPILLRESMGAAQSWSEEIGPVLSDRVIQRLQQEGVTIGR